MFLDIYTFIIDYIIIIWFLYMNFWKYPTFRFDNSLTNNLKYDMISNSDLIWWFFDERRFFLRSFKLIILCHKYRISILQDISFQKTKMSKFKLRNKMNFNNIQVFVSWIIFTISVSLLFGIRRQANFPRMLPSVSFCVSIEELMSKVILFFTKYPLCIIIYMDKCWL